MGGGVAYNERRFMFDDTLLTVLQVALLINCSEKTIYKIKELIPGYVRIHSMIRFNREKLKINKPLLTVESVAKLLNCSEQEIYKIKETLPGYVRLGSLIRFDGEKLLRAINNGSFSKQ